MAGAKRVLILAATTGYQTRMFAEAAARLGLEAVLGTDRCRHMDDPWRDHSRAVRFENPASLGELLREARTAPFEAVLGLGDRPAWLAAVAAARLKLPGNPPDAAEAAGNKYLARQRFQDAGLPVPWYRRVPLDGHPRREAHAVPYPCVLKPLGLSASRGVIRADTPEQFTAAFERIRAILDAPELRKRRRLQDRYLQVESYIEGREFAIEGLLTRGRLQTLAIFDKPDPLAGPYFEETVYTTPSREPIPLQDSLRRAAQQAVTALGLRHGPVHAEMRANEGGVWILEAAARPIGGLCAKALRFRLPGAAAPVPLEELVLRHAVGEDVSSACPADPASGVMMIPIPKDGVYVSVSGVDEARAAPGVDELIITAKEGQRLVPLPEGNSYLGFIFARAATPAAVEQALREAHARLRFEIAAALPVIAKSFNY